MSPRTVKLSAKIGKVRALMKGATSAGERAAAERRFAELMLLLEESVRSDIAVEVRQ